ncbi:dihydrofolate reductase family protein [Microbacterium stercoris]|uniref:Dihydrofolate reductase family protein n=1 Tax=Microbacterium stercoris TaxID=2820289 RepID=A0A939QLJ8_9MICO|nr:dihydrofolate reductase family protein [Microbacterium stercoris]MBO3665163.1 dihydrofolate reductase family protein [Microbacterium stercoris]
MAQLLVDYITSLDGYGSAEGWPGLWGMGGPDYFSFLDEDGREDYALLLGATTYRLFARFAETGEEFTDELAARTKYVFSHGLDEPLGLGDSTLVRNDPVAFVRELKQRDRPLRTIGSPTLVRSLLAAGLVDRYRVVVFPVVNGATGADRIYDGWPDVTFADIITRTFDGRLQLFEGTPTRSPSPPDPAADAKV